VKNRWMVRRLLLTGAMILAVWAAGAGRATAQCVECPPPQPPTCVNSDISIAAAPAVPPVPLNCTDAVATFTPENNSWTYFFDANNSIKITTHVNVPFELEVELISMTDAVYQDRVDGTPFEGTQCWPTLDGGCAFYRVHGELVSRASYGPVVDYIVGFTVPAIQGNKHDLMLLRSSAESAPIPYDGFSNSSFDEEITTKVRRNYQVGDDPGVGGDADGFSDYVVAFQRVRPASK
jgi:hypothetical protein